MENNHDHEIIDTVISFLDVFTIILVEDNPIVGIVLVALMKTVTKDRILRILLILLVIVLSVTLQDE
ncbi:hypothetical protein [Priestia abyssalis]|uniref:hypothetical protein n=1 Tax=Priestia abyssalis TaxID=1221450 RepID=UPI000994A321|nr:hypothetical protein [Priestia abyssalis]